MAEESDVLYPAVLFTALLEVSVLLSTRGGPLAASTSAARGSRSIALLAIEAGAVAGVGLASTDSGPFLICPVRQLSIGDSYIDTYNGSVMSSRALRLGSRDASADKTFGCDLHLLGT